MAFDESKVQFNPDELAAAEAADALYEMFNAALADGADLSDLTLLPAAMPHIVSLYGFLAGGTKAEYAEKLLAIAVALIRDNEFLAGLDQ